MQHPNNGAAFHANEFNVRLILDQEIATKTARMKCHVNPLEGER